MAFDLCFPKVFLGLSLRLKVLFAAELLILNNLNPVSIWVQNKSNVLHTAICQSLLPVDIQSLEALTRGVDVVNRDTWVKLVECPVNVGLSIAQGTHRCGRTLAAGHCHCGT